MHPQPAARLQLKVCFSYALVVVLALLSSCRENTNQVRLESRNFDEEIQQQQNLVFTFDKALVPADRLQQWDTIPYLRLRPAVAGRFKWTAPNELVFSPLQPFPPATDFVAELQPELLRHSTQKYQLPAQEPLRFHTPYLKLSRARAFWAENQNQPGELEARLQLSFNYPVAFRQLRQLLHVYQGRTELALEPVAGNAQTLSVKLKGLAGQPDAMPLRLHIGPGLVSQPGNKPTQVPLEQEVLLPSRQQLQVIEVSTGLEEGQPHIYVATTQPVRLDNLAGLIRLEPRVPFTVEEMEGGFVIKGDIPEQNTYQLTLPAALTSLTGIQLGKDYEHTLSFTSQQPALSFAHGKGIYLSSQGARNIALSISQVDRIKVSIGKVYENNILRLLKEGKFYEGDYDEAADQYRERSYYPVDETNGNTIFEREYDTRSLRRQGPDYLLHLNRNDLDFDADFKGLYVLTVTSTEQKWLGDSRILSVSDIGLVVRQGKNQVLVFANSLRQGTPQPGVQIRFISTNNQVIHQAQTGSDGVARFTDMDQQAPDFKVGMITARLGADFTYLPYSQTQVNTSRFEVGGKRLGTLPYDAYVYGDRDLYRPGEVVHLNTIIRTPDWQTTAGLPLKLRLLLPNGRELQSLKGKLNTEGAFACAFPLPATAATGTYTVEVYSGNDVLLNTHKIGVEEFMPDRLKVTTTLNKPSFRSGDSVVVRLTAHNLFGPPAADRNYDLQLNLKKKAFQPKRYPDYEFNIVTAGAVDIQHSVRQGRTDARGQARETFGLDGYQDIGLLDGSVYTTVFDETGRPVNRLARFEVHTQTAYYGIKKFDRYVSTRQPLRVPLLALDAGEKPIATTARIQLVRYTYESVIERSHERYNYRSQRKENILSSKTIALPAGGTTFHFTPLSSGEYEIRVMRPGALNYVAQGFYAYGWGDTESTSFEVNNEGQVDISLDKESYEVGDQARVLFKSPFAGRILVTVERDKVFSYYFLNTDKKAASLTLPITGEHLPTVYITATALRPIRDNTLPLTIARGFVPVPVTRKDTRLEVAITAPEVSRSQRVQPVTVRTAPHTQLTLAVVDEGILQLKDYRTPDPHAFFYQKRALEVEAYDLYPFLLPELTGRRSSFGGDGYDLARRLNPMTTKRVKLVSVWSGQLRANAAGEATVRVPIPEFSGALRLMAVAYKGGAFGAAEKMMRVSDPVVISTALPRFLSPGDTIAVPVTLSNTTARAGEATSTLSVTGPLRLLGPATATARLAANSEARVVFKVVAQTAIGAAAVKVQVKALGSQFSSHTDLALRPAAPLTKRTGAGSLAGGATAAIRVQHDFLPASVASRLVLSSSPIAQFTDDITYLLQYPHGCLEQTVSRAFPLLYFSDLARSINQQGKIRTYNPRYLVQEALLRIEAMQQYNGGFAFWPGAPDTDWWTSIYATHFLLEARQAGYPVNKTLLDKALSFVQRQVKNKAMEQYRFYNVRHQLESKFVAARQIAYSLYVLSIARQPDWATMNYYKARPELLSLDARYLLASAYALNGRQESFHQVLPASMAGQTSVRALDGSFYSPLRDMALALNGLLEADPDNSQTGTLARHLSQELRSSRWYNTQERAFALLALGKLARRSQGNLQARVRHRGQQLAAFTGRDLTLANRFQQGELEITTTGKGTLYYFWEAEGISRSGTYKKEDSYLQVRKAFFDRHGKPIAHNTFRQNELVVVRLSLTSLDGRSIPNVAITDLLPAGFEIENPRLAGGRELTWVQQPDEPQHTDIRDDRILIYATAQPRTQHFYYQVRAVSQGTFRMGPVGADAMYNAEYHSYSGDGLVRVR